MIEIIPNWHPTFVHFTVALFTTSVGFYALFYISSRLNITSQSLINEFEIVARWCLWVGAFITFLTLFTGLYAFNTVQHDENSYAAMEQHRNWAFPTVSGILIAACWAFLQYTLKQSVSFSFLVTLLIIEGAVISTVLHGNELVYRYGVGVISLPKSKTIGQQHYPHSNE